MIFDVHHHVPGRHVENPDIAAHITYCQQLWMSQRAPGDVFEVRCFHSSHHLAGSSIPDLDCSVISVCYRLQVSIGAPSDSDNRWLELRKTILVRNRTEHRVHNEQQQEKSP